MSRDDMSALWWNQITGPANVVRQVTDALMEKKHVIVSVPADIPWRHQMRASVLASLKQRFGSLEMLVHTIDVADDCPEETDVGRYLLRKVSSGQVASGYRDRTGETIQSYLSRCNVLKDTIIWVKGMNAAQMERWRLFCRSYSVKDASNGLFVLENTSGPDCPGGKNIAVIDYQRCVSLYDTQIFNSIVLDSEFHGLSQVWKQYVSAVCASLCGTDAQVSYDLMRETDFLNESPLDALKRLAASDSYQSRGADPDSEHIFAHVRRQDEDFLIRKVWTAQLQVAFPIIELERVNLIQRWEDNFRQACSFKPVKRHGAELKDPYEIELGTMFFLMNYKEEGSYWLYLPDQQAREQIGFLRDCRNTLAHVNVCQPGELQRLFACADEAPR